ncbi:hypothetical protein O3P69_000610 [Scylla paramamosain]|uniref:Uncharacterized protein n=1 Tax=Scylla paramamosain TaxID=85552 RepID=A0AAW0USY7_SCYPA
MRRRQFACDLHQGNSFAPLPLHLCADFALDHSRCSCAFYGAIVFHILTGGLLCLISALPPVTSLEPHRTTMWLEVVTAVLAVVLATLVSLRVWYRTTSGRCTSRKSMVGKTVVITGATAGIGKETARDLLRRGARVIIACRNLEKGCRVASELQANGDSRSEVVVRHLDTSDLSSVRNFAKEVLDTEKAIHVLINNAGAVFPDKRQVTADGLELTMATNYFGHFPVDQLVIGTTKGVSPESCGHRVLGVSRVCQELGLEGP